MKLEKPFCKYCRGEVKDFNIDQNKDYHDECKEAVLKYIYRWVPNAADTDWLKEEFKDWTKDRIRLFISKKKLTTKFNTQLISNELTFFPFYVNFPYSYQKQKIETSLMDLERFSNSVNQIFMNYNWYRHKIGPYLFRLDYVSGMPTCWYQSIEKYKKYHNYPHLYFKRVTYLIIDIKNKEFFALCSKRCYTTWIKHYHYNIDLYIINEWIYTPVDKMITHIQNIIHSLKNVKGPTQFAIKLFCKHSTWQFGIVLEKLKNCYLIEKTEYGI